MVDVSATFAAFVVIMVVVVMIVLVLLVDVVVVGRPKGAQLYDSRKYDCQTAGRERSDERNEQVQTRY